MSMVAIESFAAKALSVVALFLVNHQLRCLAVFNSLIGFSIVNNMLCGADLSGWIRLLGVR